jgi:DNA invertase Pin-like site-specific DNA recombinase
MNGKTRKTSSAQLRWFAATQGWTVAYAYEDRATGKHGDRDQFQELFAAAFRREFDCLLFWSLDRLSLEGTVETLNHLQSLSGYGQLQILHGAIP